MLNAEGRYFINGQVKGTKRKKQRRNNFLPTLLYLQISMSRDNTFLTKMIFVISVNKVFMTNNLLMD
jgi:hypothetical protein